MESPQDLLSWTGKPPQQTEDAARDKTDGDNNESGSEASGRNYSTAPSEASSGAGDINYDGSPVVVQSIRSPVQAPYSDDEDDLIEVLPQFQHRFYIEIPPMADAEKETYKFMPGYFAADEIIAEQPGQRFVVRMESGAKQLVSHPILMKLQSVATRSSLLARVTWVEVNFVDVGRQPGRLCLCTCGLLYCPPSPSFG